VLHDHKRSRAELKMKNRTTYRDLDLVFAKESDDVRRPADSLGIPLAWNNIGTRDFARVIKAPQVGLI
jgi:hypothetical protein